MIINLTFRISFIIIALIAALGHDCFAAEPASTEYTEEIKNTSPEEQTADGKRQKWVLFPVIARTEETGFQYGALVFYFFPKTSASARPSTVGITAVGTEKNQRQLEIFPEFHFHGGAWRFKPYLAYKSWPADYYGTGNNSSDSSESFEDLRTEAEFILDRRFAQSFRAGVIYRYRRDDIEPKAGGILQSDDVYGKDGMEVSGTGISVSYDTRDNGFAPLSGNLVGYDHIFYRQSFGSEFDYDVNLFNLRHYFRTGPVSTFAVAAHVRATSGQTPFLELSTPNGYEILRGVKNGRYRDNDLLSLQAEYRFPIRGKFGMTLFTDAAQVAPSYGNFSLDEFKYSFGAGLRYALNPSERLNLRIDLSWVDSGIGLLVYIREAF